MGLGGPRLSLAAAVAVATLTGCYKGSAHAVSLSDVRQEPGWSIVSDVPLIRQKAEHDCGAAALAMVLDHWGVRGTEREVRGAVQTPPDHGLPAGALRDFSRSKGLHAFLISGTESDLVREVQLNRPVLVGLVQRYSGKTAYAHYEVVIGINAGARRVLLLDPGHGAREDDLAAFGREWEGAGRLALVVAPA